MQACCASDYSRVTMPLNFGRDVRVQPYFGYRNSERLIISARALRADKPNFELSGRLQAIRTMLAQFASREVADLPVQLELERPDGKRFTHEAVTNAEGFAEFDIALDGEWSMPADSAWEIAALRWDNAKGPQKAHAHILVPGTRADLAIISDIDDTLIETGITGSFRAIARNWKRVVAQLPEERLAVPGVDVFYSALSGSSTQDDGISTAGARIDAPKRPFFYVSSSPWNLFSYLVAFKRMRGLPLGPIKLRDWGFNRRTLGHSSHGDHKTSAIADILAHFPNLQFALVGDDTQKDLIAFGKIVTEHPNRVKAVFIRKASKDEFTAEEKAAHDAIQAADVAFWMGSDYSTGQDFLVDAGLTGSTPAAKIVRTIEQNG